MGQILGTTKLLFGALILGATTTIGAAGFAGKALADTVSVQGEVIKVHASVAPMTYVLIDRTGQIIQIDSNNNLDTPPSVYIDTVKTGNERPLTPEIYTQFRALLPTGTNHIGTRYKLSASTKSKAEASSTPDKSASRQQTNNRSITILRLFSVYTRLGAPLRLV